MQNDRTTLKDLSFFAAGEAGIFHLLDHTTTAEGREVLRKHVLQPPERYETLAEIQESVTFFAENPDAWIKRITNGTLVMLEKFFESADSMTQIPGKLSLLLSGLLRRVLNRNEYSFTHFSISHLSDFILGCKELILLLERQDLPEGLKKILLEIKAELEKQRLAEEVAAVGKNTPYQQLARLSYLARREMKNPVYRLIRHYARLDAWQAMAAATVKNKWVFPELQPSFPVKMQAKGLYHPLLKNPVAYDVDFDQEQNFLFLTGANMSGKTTFMRSLGVSALLAHLGMGVPATEFRISFLNGIITNMQVSDNLLLGESYFFAEVQRIKQTAAELQKPLPNLVLMDELFKGTNVHDAFECTKAVVEGLLLHRRHIMVLSTHLYEVAQQFKDRPEIMFACFVTEMTAAGNFRFTYELKPGISDDRIGYRILQKEGVLDLLHNTKGSA